MLHVSAICFAALLNKNKHGPGLLPETRQCACLCLCHSLVNSNQGPITNKAQRKPHNKRPAKRVNARPHIKKGGTEFRVVCSTGGGVGPARQTEMGTSGAPGGRKNHNRSLSMTYARSPTTFRVLFTHHVIIYSPPLRFRRDQRNTYAGHSC